MVVLNVSLDGEPQSSSVVNLNDEPRSWLRGTPGEKKLARYCLTTLEPRQAHAIQHILEKRIIQTRYKIFNINLLSEKSGM